MNYTSEDIRSYQFQKAGISGYKAADVDDFLDNVARDYDEFARAKEEFAEKLAVLADKINEYRDNEDAVKEAILRAQKTGDQILRERKEAADTYYNEKTVAADAKTREAEQVAEKVVSEAQIKAQSVLDKSSIEGQRILTQAQERAKELTRESEIKLRNEQEAYARLKAAVDNFKDELFDAYKQHMTLISAIKSKSYAAEHIDIGDAAEDKPTEEKSESAE